MLEFDPSIFTPKFGFRHYGHSVVNDWRRMVIGTTLRFLFPISLKL